VSHRHSHRREDRFSIPGIFGAKPSRVGGNSDPTQVKSIGIPADDDRAQPEINSPQTVIAIAAVVMALAIMQKREPGDFR
jgi:hypothetical protein